MTYFYKKRTARRPWQRRQEMERRLAARAFGGNAVYHSKKSLRRDRRKEEARRS